MSLPQTIRASVHEHALTNLHRMFGATAADAFRELFQNARRAGASHTDVMLHPYPTDATKVWAVVRDDGCGIADPQALLSFGYSGWQAEDIRAEHPAGMGLASLARSGCHVESRIPGGPAWQADLDESAFAGRRDVHIEPLPEEKGPRHGTTISFELACSLTHAVSEAKACAKFHKAKIVLHVPLEEPQTLSGHDFLKGAIRVEREDAHGVPNLRIGVFHDNSWETHPTLNVLGLNVKAQLPRALPAFSRSCWRYNSAGFSVRAAVDGPINGLELVLPRRYEMTKNDFAERLDELGRKALYRAMRDDPSVVPTFEQWEDAWRLHIALQEAPPALCRWQPARADEERNWRDTPVQLPEGAFVVDVNDDPTVEQTLALALDENGLRHLAFEPSRELSGFFWHKKLLKAGPLRVLVYPSKATDDAEPDPECVDAENYDPEKLGTPERATVELQGLGKVLEASVVCLGQSYDWPWEGNSVPVICKGKTASSTLLLQIAEKAYFSPSDEPEADSRDTQLETFRQEASKYVTELLEGPQAAWEETIRQKSRRHLLNHVPKGKVMVLTLDPDDLENPVHWQIKDRSEA